MSGPTTRTIPLSSKELDSAIEVLASAGQALRLTLFERIAYRALVISADVLLATLAFVVLFRIPFLFMNPAPWAVVVEGLAVFLFFAAILALIISLALNVPLFLKASREQAQLRKRGLGALSDFLWNESWRNRRMRQARFAAGFAIIVLDPVLTAGMWLSGRTRELLGNSEVEIGNLVVTAVPVFVLLVVFLVLARYLQNLRGRIDLVSNAAELRKALQDLRQRTDVGVVAVPIELLEWTAKIESTQIAEERKEAVLEGTASRAKAYAVAFDGNAGAQRAHLGIQERLELEDLVADLSVEGAHLAPQHGAAPGSTLRATSEGKRIEIEYSIDRASQSIRIVNCVVRAPAVPAA